MSLDQISLRHLRHFVDVAEKGSFARVSALLDVDQPTLSRSVKRIETELGAPVFHRNGRGVTLTDHGRRFLEEVRGFLGGLGALQEDIAAERDSPRGQVRFAVLHHLSEGFAPRLLARFRAECPEVQVHLAGGQSGAIQNMLVEGEIDLGILYDGGNLADLGMEQLSHERLYLLGRADVARAHGLGAEAPLAALPGLPLALPGRHHGLRRSLDTQLERQLDGAALAPIYEVDLLPALRALVMAEGLFTVLPLDAALRAAETGPIYLAPLVAPEVHCAISLALARNRPLSRATRAFARAIRDEMRGHLSRQEATAQALTARAGLPYITSDALFAERVKVAP